MPLQIIRQDITKMKVDAIVNTTNEEMIGYSGVDLAIHTIAGPELDEECSKIAPLFLGQAKITNAYNLPSKYVIHTSGPTWHGGNNGEADVLCSCYLKSLKLAVANKCKSIAFPLISSGVYCFPKDKVLRYAVQTITEFLFDNELQVYLCVFDQESYELSTKLFCDISTFIDDHYVEEQLELEEVYLGDFHILSDEAAMPIETPPTKEKKRTTKAKGVLASNALPPQSSLEDYLKTMDKSFAETLFQYIDERGMTDVECYKKANIDKKTFSKIKCNKNYRPSKQTVLAFAIALKLNLEETQHLLETVGMALSHSNKFDVIVEYFIIQGQYDIFLINEALFTFDQTLLGSL